MLSFSGAKAASDSCDPALIPKAPTIDQNFTGTHQTADINSCYTNDDDLTKIKTPRCVTLSPKGNTIHFWKFGDGIQPSDDPAKFQYPDKPTQDSTYNFAAKGDLSFLSEGGGNFIFRSKNESGFYYAVEKYSNLDVGKLDAISTTGYFRTGKTTVWDSFMGYNKAWDIYNASTSCDPHLPTLESGVNSDSSRYIWRIVIVGKLQFGDKTLKNRGNVSLRLASKDGPTLDTVPTDNEGNFEFSRKYQAGEGVGNEEIWLNSNIEKNVTLSFTYTDENENKYQAFKTLNLDSDFRNHATLNDTKVTKELISFNLTEKNKVDNIDRDESATSNSIGDNLFGKPGDEYCPSSSWAKPTTWFASSLCGLGIALHDAGVKLMNFAQDQLFAVLGYTSTSNQLKAMGY